MADFECFHSYPYYVYCFYVIPPNDLDLPAWYFLLPMKDISLSALITVNPVAYRSHWVE